MHKGLYVLWQQYRKNGQYHRFRDTEKSGLFFTLSPNNIYREVLKLFLFNDDSFAAHS